MMSHKDHFFKARKNYIQKDKPDYSLTNVGGMFNNAMQSMVYKESVYKLKNKITDIFDNTVSSGLLKQFRDDIFKYPNIGYIANEILPQLEKNLYGCNLFVDKVHIWRTLFFNKDKTRKWEWYFDNEPPSVWKILINLSNHKVSAFDYLEHESGGSQIMIPTHISSEKWKGPRYGHNIPLKYINFYIYNNKCTLKTLILKSGEFVIFNNNLIRKYHKAVTDKHMDFLELRIRPTIDPVNNYFDRKYTTSYDHPSAINIDPELKRIIK